MPRSGTSNAPIRLKFDLAWVLLGIACGLAAATAVVYFVQIPLQPVGARDYVVYWATGQQLLHHGNPYDPNVMSSLEHSAGLAYPGSYFMRNPPWTLPLAVLLGLCSASAAALPWTLLMLAVLVASVAIVWPVLRAKSRQLSLLGFVFPPALHGVIAGQTSLFVLLGLALFLRFHKTRPFWAGASLWFCTVKPHILIPFAMVWLVWVLATRAWKMLAGALTAVAASCLLTECIDPAVWSQYLHWAGSSGIGAELIPCLGVALRQLISPTRYWIAFVPVVAGTLWALIWFLKRRHSWDWFEQGNVLVLLSILVAPYCWIWDQSAVIPALLYGVSRTRSRVPLALLAVAYIAIDIQELTGVSVRSWLYIWPSIFWLAWYLLTRSRGLQSVAESRVEAGSVGALG
ncbi:MAG TPA: glycosyltransferase family 87 protein [Acidobacteriaceae bacterium]|nr:glycosyltransferase family 87 protein [Acidobacteriaceae bacterium]